MTHTAGTALVAIGGNVLLRGGPRATIDEQFEAARTLARPLRQLIEQGWRLVITHGNGPQVGFILRRSDLLAQLAPEIPRLDLDMCVADSQGSLGYILGLSLQNELRAAGRSEQVVSLLTHTVVDATDQAFQEPTKPIGSFYDEATAHRLAAENGWTVQEDSGRGWRRIVPSPRPVRILEQDAVASLVGNGFVVIAAGGGGIPVIEESGGGYGGVEAVIDKDFTSALLAAALQVDLLVITTGVAQVAVDFGQPSQRYLGLLPAAEARRHLSEGQFPPGSMGPKIEAALQFLHSGRPAVVTSPDRLLDAVAGRTGTRLVC